MAPSKPCKCSVFRTCLVTLSLVIINSIAYFFTLHKSSQEPMTIVLLQDPNQNSPTPTKTSQLQPTRQVAIEGIHILPAPSSKHEEKGKEKVTPYNPYPSIPTQNAIIPSKDKDKQSRHRYNRAKCTHRGKVFAIGHFKTGTKSIKRGLEALGYRCFWKSCKFIAMWNYFGGDDMIKKHKLSLLPF